MSGFKEIQNHDPVGICTQWWIPRKNDTLRKILSVPYIGHILFKNMYAKQTKKSDTQKLSGNLVLTESHKTGRNTTFEFPDPTQR